MGAVAARRERRCPTAMRLLLFSQQFKTFTSGLGTYARGLVEGLVRRGHRVTLAVPREQGEQLPGLHVVPMAFPRGNVTPFAAPRMAREYARVLATEGSRHDVVHFLDAREAALGHSRIVSGRKPTVVGSIHDVYALDWCDPQYPRGLYDDRLVRGVYFTWQRWLERRAYRVPSAFAANSRYVAAAVARGYGVPPDRIDVIPIGVTTGRPVEPVPLRGAPAILFVGGNYLRKGLSVLLQAFARVRASHPKASLHVVGGDAKVDRFRRRADALGVGRAVAFHGWQPHERVRAMMAGASLLAMPSLVEAFGLVYLEAMSAGIPVVASDRGGTTEFLVDGEDALVVPPRDVAALAAALERAAGDESLRARLIAGGRSTVARLTMESTVDRTEALYVRVQGGPVVSNGSTGGRDAAREGS